MRAKPTPAALASAFLEHEDHEQLRVVVEATPVAIIVVDEHTRIALANGHAQLLFGYSSAELLGKDAELLVPKRFQAAYLAMRQEYLRNPVSRPMGDDKRLVGRRKDGTEVPIEIGLNPVRTRSATFTLAAIVDITERQQAEERKHREEQMGLVIDGAANAMIVTDGAGRITLVNSQVERMFGYRRHELLNRPVEILVPDRLRDAHLRVRESRAGSPEPRALERSEFLGFHKDGREVPIEIGLRPLSTSRGEFVLASIIDITDRKHADELRGAEALHAAELTAISAEMRSVEVSLVSSELRARRQAERLESLWRVAHNPTLDGPDLILAMLRQAAAGIRLNQRFRGLLGRVEGDEVVTIAVGVDPNDDDPRAGLVQAGTRTALDETTIPRGPRTRSCDDYATRDVVSETVRRLGWRASISTQFDAGGSRYALTFASLEPMITPFSSEDFAYIELLASSFATHLHVNTLTDSLRAEEADSRQHAERLVALWRLVNDPSLHEEELWAAMLGQAAADLRPGQVYQGNLWRVEGADMVLEAVTSAPHLLGGNFRTVVGAKIPLTETVIGKLLAEGTGTRSWDDIQDTAYSGTLARATGIRTFVITTFVVGGATWGLAFASAELTRKPLGAQDHAYIEVLASYFAHHVQQRWQFDRMQYQQSHDGLTGLLNRPQFRSQAGAASAASQAYAIILIDIDAFREINESYGHVVGDALIVEVGKTLRGRATADEIVGRITSDAFAVCVPNPVSRDFVRTRALDFAEAFARGFSTGNLTERGSIALTASLGIAVAPEDGSHIDATLSHADAALSAAKERGHGSLAFYEPGMEGDALRRTDLRNELTMAINGNQFTLYYQPHVEISTGTVMGCEALIRWKHPQRGLLPPGTFIPFAEQTGLITGIDAWVMRNALAAVNDLSAGRPGFRIFFNLSGRQAGDPKLIRSFIAAARDGVRLANVGVEITESDAMRDFEATRRVCRALRRLDVRVAIDDFGTGYSSLSALKRLPVDIVKIDRSFISGILHDTHDETIAETILSISEHFGFASFAEGVERLEEMEWLRQRSCRYVQGFALCEPLPLEEFKSWLAAYRG